MTVSRRAVVTALWRGARKRCPHCGVGRVFSGWAKTADHCPACGLVYERNAGDTWAFTIIGDRLPVAAALALVYFGMGRISSTVGTVSLAITGVFLLWTSPNRWGVGIALHYLSRIYWPDPSDPVPTNTKL